MSFKVVSLPINTTITAFFHLTRESVNTFFSWRLSSTSCVISWMSSTLSKLWPFMGIYNFRNRAKSQWAKSCEYGRYQMVAIMFLLKNYCYHWSVNSCIVLMQQPVLVFPQFGPFLSHIFSWPPQNATIKIWVHYNTSWYDLPMDNAFDVVKHELDEQGFCWPAGLF